MNRILKNLLAFLLIVCLAMPMLSACGTDENEPVNEPPVSESTDKLTLYISTQTKPVMDAAIAVFRKQYPDVQLDIRDYSYSYEDSAEHQTEAAQNFTSILNTDLLGGKGPDVIVWSDGSIKDVYKVAQADVFLDLNSYMDTDKDFDKEAYFPLLLNSGLYKNERIFVPITFYAPVVLTIDKQMEATSINLDQIKSFSDFTQAINQYIDSNSGKHPFYQTNLNFWTYLDWSGLELVNYEDQKLNTNAPEFRELMDAYKTLYPREHDSTNNTEVEVLSLRNGKAIFTKAMTLFSFCQNYSGLLYKDAPQFKLVPGYTGSPSARASVCAGIRKNSPNKANAYNFLKILLSEEVQASKDNFHYPVLKSAVSAYITDQQKSMIGNGITADIPFQQIPQDDIDRLTEEMGKIDSVLIASNYISSTLEEEMTPYFKGQKSYEDCLKVLNNKLELYISE